MLSQIYAALGNVEQSETCGKIAQDVRVEIVGHDVETAKESDGVNEDAFSRGWCCGCCGEILTCSEDLSRLGLRASISGALPQATDKP